MLNVFGKDTPWMNKEVKKAIKNKSKAWNSKSTTNHEHYKEMRNRATVIMRKEKIDFESWERY